MQKPQLVFSPGRQSRQLEPWKTVRPLPATTLFGVPNSQHSKHIEVLAVQVLPLHGNA